MWQNKKLKKKKKKADEKKEREPDADMIYLNEIMEQDLREKDGQKAQVHGSIQSEGDNKAFADDVGLDGGHEEGKVNEAVEGDAKGEEGKEGAKAPAVDAALANNEEKPKKKNKKWQQHKNKEEVMKNE